MKHLSFLIPFALLALKGTVGQEVVHAAVAVHRHGDRTWKGEPPTKLTALGKSQCVGSGKLFKERYLSISSPQHIEGISEVEYLPKHIYASAPDQQLLVSSAHAILQGFFPPRKRVEDIKLFNGEIVIDNSDGQQFPLVHTISTNDPDTVWLKGDDLCPQHSLQISTYSESPEFSIMKSDTQEFYQSLKADFLAGVFKDNEIGYQCAYQIFDYLNVAKKYNGSIADKITDDMLDRLRILADAHEFALYGNVSEKRYAMTIAGRTLATKIVAQLESNIQKYDMNKFSLLISSYDAFLAFFSLTSLVEDSDDFYGLPDYASTMVFELVSVKNEKAYPQPDDLFIKFYFRNGTADKDLVPYRLFGMPDLLMPWMSFKEAVNKFAVRTLAEWCERCTSVEPFCLANEIKISNEQEEYGQGYEGGSVRSQSNSGGRQDIGERKKEMSLVVAGVIGAMVTLGMGAMLVVLAIAVFGVRFARSKRFSLKDKFKGGEKLPSEIDLRVAPQGTTVGVHKL